jgi:hypothetical protein
VLLYETLHATELSQAALVNVVLTRTSTIPPIMPSTTQPLKPTKPSSSLRALRLRLSPVLVRLRPKFDPISPNTLSSAIAVSKIVKDASEAAPVPGAKAVVGILVTIFEGVQVRLVEPTIFL